MLRPAGIQPFLHFEGFELVSSFEIRISNFHRQMV
jgi:hypothetical protein